MYLFIHDIRMNILMRINSINFENLVEFIFFAASLFHMRQSCYYVMWVEYKFLYLYIYIFFEEFH